MRTKNICQLVWSTSDGERARTSEKVKRAAVRSIAVIDHVSE
jgi:hypothetical protein